MSKILIIDDEKNIRVTLNQCLEMSGYQMDSAVSGEHGLEKFENEDFDLILLDMKMPGIDGMEVLRRIKKRNPVQNVVMITAHGTIETAVEAMKLGAIDFLRKPFTPDEIRAIVKKVLARDQLREEDTSSFDHCLEFAKGCINQRELEKGETYLRKALSLDPSKPEPFNLLGVIHEYRGEIPEGLKMYRAALALDPSYQPAAGNLERASQWRYSRSGINLGDTIPAELAENKQGSGE